IKIIVDSFKLDPNVKKEASSLINVEATKARETNSVYAAFSVDRRYGKAPLFNGVRLTYTDYAAVDDVTKQFCYSDIAYEISWGDSATDISEPSTRCSKTSSFTASEFHTYNIAGTYTISVTATDTRSGEVVIEGEQEVIVRPE
ncbi:hypothetical protein IID27_02295, partial [Patescibacteria group bacterium]|nr:hypothetical protein [Patescibacteria group bacterium]